MVSRYCLILGSTVTPSVELILKSTFMSPTWSYVHEDRHQAMKAILLTKLRNGFESEDRDASIGNHKSLVREARVSQHLG